ncbi:universal stress protein [Pseudonocardia sp. GCM10023141]|uniref:universal stress protein n=1 Tax=Pseudonocardia sp. GCM10023141 TaxID=3252653 RepID=UPI00360BDE22
MDGQDRGQTLVVGVDGSQFALRAVRWAADEAGRRKVPLRIVHAFQWIEDRGRSGPGVRSGHREIALERARHLIAAAAREALEQAPGIEVERQLVVGDAIGVLTAETVHAQLVVVGDRGHSRFDGMIMGSVPVALAVHAACPIVVVRGRDRETTGAAVPAVVVGVDGTPLSEAAIAFAFDAAATRGAPLVAVHTWIDLISDPNVAAIIDRDIAADDERRVLSESLAGWSEKYPDVPVEQVVAHGRPAHTLLDLSTRAQLLVVGSRRHGDFTGLFLGSVSNTLVHRAACPVAVVQPDTAVPA